ncbi:MAG: protein kinase domain-containing protein [Acidobacteriota bacterium]
MTLSSGRRLGPYEIGKPLGAGGMGEVYGARDSRLGRDVALKVLPEAFARDADRMVRFQREAQVLASLSHTNIAAIYGLEESDNVRALVMELVQGPTLAERIAGGPIPIEDAIPIAKQIADALEYAHDRGIVHRDLKPANIKITPDGAVKVLDFGLAKALEGDLTELDAAKSPTITLGASMGGVILGTAAYMSPEQARGKPADRRSDIWSFGCVLYEMLAGKQAFDGETVSDKLAAVLRADIDWKALPTGTPATIVRLLGRCLERDPRRRLQSIAEARILVENFLDGSDSEAIGSEAAAASAAPRQRRQSALPWVLSAVLAVTLIVGAWALWPKPSVPAPALRLDVQVGADVHLGKSWGADALLSNDGRRLILTARGTDQKWRVFVRPLDKLEATVLSGTEEARNTFVSPDGQWIAFFAGETLKKISVQGGAAVTLCSAVSDRGGSWGEDDMIVFAPDSHGGLAKVPSAGGTPEPLTTLDRDAGEVTHRWPQLTPGAKTLIFTAHTSTSSFDDATIVAQSLETGIRKTVVRGGFYGRYLPSGHVVYVHNATLFAVPFDIQRLETSGQPVPVIEKIAVNSDRGAAQFDFSQTGILSYVPGTAAGGVSVYWMDASGKMAPLIENRAEYFNPRFSPDGKRLALDIAAGTGRDVWIYELQRDTMTRLTFDGAGNSWPIWSPDGGRVAFFSDRKGAPGVYWKRADGAGDTQLMFTSKGGPVPQSWRRDGKFLTLLVQNPETNVDIFTLPVTDDERPGPAPAKPEPFLASPFIDVLSEFSPDGRWLAYVSNESGNFEVYVRPFPGPGGKWQISTAGGSLPTWSRNGKELFYRSNDQRIWVCTYSASDATFRPDKPRLWSQGQFTERGNSRNFDLAPDGKRFAVLKAPAGDRQSATDRVVLIQNFFDELQRLAPSRK